jgi:hypothetical protein
MVFVMNAVVGKTKTRVKDFLYQVEQWLFFMIISCCGSCNQYVVVLSAVYCFYLEKRKKFYIKLIINDRNWEYYEEDVEYVFKFTLVS